MTPEVLLLINLQAKQLCAVKEINQIPEICYPITIGKRNTPTPKGEFQIERIVSQPIYQNCIDGKIYPGSFLGAFAFVTDLNTSLPDCPFAVHGTSGKMGIEDSKGCVRMRNQDIKSLVNNYSFSRGIIQ